jgi:hypothetical protein
MHGLVYETFFSYAVYESPNGKSRGFRDTKRASVVLCVICLLLLIREIFATATIRDVPNEHLWYPLYALPEILAIALYATPDLVPARSELPK